MAEPTNALIPQPELRQWDAPWYKRIPYAITDALYGPNANAPQGQTVNKLFGTENPLNVLGQAQESGEMLGRGVKFGDAATAGIGALGAGLAVIGLGGRGGRVMAPEGKGALRAAMPEPNPQGITAYHGSPHDFERFDMSKIGTGEGAQAYGHGLYFAENEVVAKGYRDKLTSIPGAYSVSGVKAPSAVKQYIAGDDWSIAAINKNAVTYRDSQLKKLEEIQKNASLAPRKERKMWEQLEKDVRAEIDKADRELAEINKFDHKDILYQDTTGKGRLYEVRINANADDFLDLDKPLSQQSEAVRRRVSVFGDKVTSGDPLGLDLMQSKIPFELRYEHGIKGMPGDKLASLALKEAGIPGVRYLDQGSRAAQDGSRNIVVFDDKLIEILRKYGLAGLIGAGGAAASGQDASAAPVNRLFTGAP